MVRLRRRLRSLGHAFRDMARVVLARWYGMVTLLLPLYLWTLSQFPTALLWNIATGVSCGLCVAALRWPRAVVWWLPPCVLLFNTVAHWLPWPYVKMTYIAPLAASCALWVVRPGRVRMRAGLHPVVIVVLVCAACSIILGVASYIVWAEPATWEELRYALRMVPVLADRDMFVGLRYGYVWLVALAAYAVCATVVTTRRDVRCFIISLHLTALPIAAFALYSYTTGKYMVSYYVYEQRVNATCTSPAVLADVMTVIFVLGLQQLLRARRWFAWLVWGGAALIELVVIVLTGCRLNLVLLALVVGVGVVWRLIVYVRQPRHALQFLAMLVIVGLIGGGVVSWQWGKIRQLPVARRLQDWRQGLRTRQFRNLVLPGRIDHWHCALRMLRAEPLWGVGTGLFEAHYLRFRPTTDLFEYARAHNAYLRVGAEAGVVTVSAVVTALGWAVWRLQRALRGSLAWASHGRGLSICLGLVALAALSSDVAVENVEMVVFWAMLAGVLRACVWQCEQRMTTEPSTWAAWWAHAEHRWRHWCGWRGWGRLRRMRLRTVVLVGVLCVLAVLFLFGLEHAGMRALARLRGEKLFYGFRYLERSQASNVRWYTMPQHALATMPATHPLLLIRYRALNARMAQYAQPLGVYINGTYVAGVPVASVEEQQLYCDISALRGQPLQIALRVPRAWVPWREGWSARYYPCGAVVGLPQLSLSEPSNVYGTVNAVWSTNFSAYPNFYQMSDR